MKQSGFTERHKLADAYGDQQYVVVRSNPSQDLYAVRPAFGGPEKWLNRKMLLLDPRGELSLPLGPQSKNSLDGDDHSLSDRSSSDPESSGDEWVLTAPPGAKPRRSEVKTPPFGTTHTSSSQGEPPRRSERLRKRRGTAPWPNAVT